MGKHSEMKRIDEERAGPSLTGPGVPRRFIERLAIADAMGNLEVKMGVGHDRDANVEFVVAHVHESSYALTVEQARELANTFEQTNLEPDADPRIAEVTGHIATSLRWCADKIEGKVQGGIQ